MAAFPLGGATYDGSGIASSGVLNKDQTFSLTFTQPGVFEYLCLVHPEMKSQVHIAAEHAATSTPHQIGASAEELLANSGLPHHPPEAPRRAPASVVVGEGTAEVSHMRFVPGDVEIHVRETVTFANHDLGQMPHTVSFRSGRPSPDAIVPMVQAAGPPLLVFNPDVVEPRGAAHAFDGAEYLNSGILIEAAGQPFSVTFTQPGTYEYVCVFHENMGMRRRRAAPSRAESPLTAIPFRPRRSW
jgi:plastocyanin